MDKEHSIKDTVNKIIDDINIFFEKSKIFENFYRF